MNLEKANIKVLVANSLGADLEDRVEGEEKAAHELRGAADALRQAAQKVPRDLAAKLDRSLDEGEVKEGLSALEAISFTKLYLSKVGDFLNHLADTEHKKAVMQQGRVDGLRQAMGLIQETRDQEAKKIQAIVEADPSDDVDLRTSASLARKEKGTLADRRATQRSSEPSEPRNIQRSQEIPETPKNMDRGAAEQAARKAHGSLAERRSARAVSQTESRKKKGKKPPKKPRRIKD